MTINKKPQLSLLNIPVLVMSMGKRKKENVQTREKWWRSQGGPLCFHNQVLSASLWCGCISAGRVSRQFEVCVSAPIFWAVGQTLTLSSGSLSDALAAGRERRERWFICACPPLQPSAPGWARAAQAIVKTGDNGFNPSGQESSQD